MLCFLKCTSGIPLSWPEMQRCSPVAFLVVQYGKPLDVTSNDDNIMSKMSDGPAKGSVCQLLRNIATLAKRARDSWCLFFTLGRLEFGDSNFLFGL